MVKKLLKLLPDRFRKKIVPLALSLLAKTLLDLLSLATLVPFLLLLFDREKTAEKLGFNPDTHTLVLLLAALVLVLLLKWVTRISLDRFQIRTVLDVYSYFSRNMFKAYFNRGLQFVRSHTASELAYNVNVLCYAFSLNVLLPSIALVTESLITVAILTAVTVISPYSALTIVISVLPSLLLYIFLVRKRLSKYGKEEMKARSKSMHMIADTFRGYSDMVVNELFPKQDRRFEDMLRDISARRLSYNTLSSIPSGLMEICIVLCLAVLVLLNSGGQVDIGLTLAFMGVAVIRVVPAVKGIVGTWATIRNSRFVTETILDAMSGVTGEQVKDEARENKMSAGRDRTEFSSVRVSDLRFSYENGTELYDGLSFEIRRGDRVGMRGTSGIGKTTLFNILLGLLEPGGGKVCRLSADGRDMDMETWHRMIGYVPQDVYIMHATIAENVAIGLDFETGADGKPVIGDKDRADILECLESAQLGDFIKSLPDGIMTVMGDAGCSVSGGQKQRIGIARALWKRPQLLFFDEATSSLDSETEMSLTESIQNLATSRTDITMIFISHRESLLSVCGNIIELCPKKEADA